MKKTLSILLSLILVFTLSLTVMASPFGDHPQFDMGGETITIVSHMNPGGAFEEGEGKAHLEDVEETFNVNIEFKNVPWQDINQELSASVLAGDPMGDVILPSRLWMIGYLEDGILRPITQELKDLNFYDRLPEMNRDFVEEYNTFMGEDYAFGNYNDGGARGFIWNKALFEREGLPNPYELYEAGEWNFENFMDIATQATRDTDGDGEIDQWGIGSTHGLDSERTEDLSWETGLYLAYANGGRIFVEEDGMMTFGATDSKFVEGLNFARELVENDVHAQTPEGGIPEEFMNGNIAMLDAAPGEMYTLVEEMEDEYGFILYPKGPQAEDNISIGRGDLFFYVMPIGVERPEATIEITNALLEMTEPYLDTEEYTDDLFEDWSEVVWDEETMAMLEDFYEKQVICYLAPWSVPGMDPALKSVLDGEEDATSALDAISSQAQTRIDEIFRQ